LPTETYTLAAGLTFLLPYCEVGNLYHSAYYVVF